MAKDKKRGFFSWLGFGRQEEQPEKAQEDIQQTPPEAEETNNIKPMRHQSIKLRQNNWMTNCLSVNLTMLILLKRRVSGTPPLRQSMLLKIYLTQSHMFLMKPLLRF